MIRCVLDKREIINGLRSDLKLVALAVDDYCIRLSSRDVRDYLVAAGTCLFSPFDHHYPLDAGQYIDSLLRVLDACRDGKGRPVTFTSHAMSANLNFASFRSERQRYENEEVSEAFARLLTE